jgi:drug/metabolite transporter (DMT)-like permease
MGRPPPSRVAVAAFGLLVVLVGTNLVAIRYSNRELAPFWNAGFRFALASVGFAAIARVRGVARPSRADVASGIAYGLLGFAGFFGFLYAGLVHATAALGQTMLALGPLVTMFLAAATGTERLQARAIVGALISVVGIAVSFGAASALNVPLGSLILLAAAATSFAAAGIVARRSRAAEPTLQNMIATAVGAVVLLAISAASGEPWHLPATPGTWVAFGYLVIPGTLVIFLLFLWLLRRWTATAVSYQFILAPLVSITLGAILLGEPAGTGAALGAALVIAGVYVGAIAPTR